ncbi:MAG: hypothetical protein ABIS05_27015 [Roseateles sp.]
MALALTAALQPAIADVVLSFEDIKKSADPADTGIVQLLDRYKDSGVRFTGDAWGVVSSEDACNNGFGNFFHDGGCTALLLGKQPGGAASPTASFTLNFAAGFIGGSSLNYAGLPRTTGSISLFSDLDGIGKLAAFDVKDLQLSGCSVDPAFSLCDWNNLVLGFSGVARSMVITGTDQALMLDDLSLKQAATAPGSLPEPASLVLAFSALGALAWARKRAAR